MPYPARSILAIAVSPFGQSLGLLPAMRALRASYPQSLIVAAASSGICQLLNTRDVDEKIDLGVIKSSDTSQIGALRRSLGLIRRARRYNFDLVLDFSPRVETQIISRLIWRARTLTPFKLPGAIEKLFGAGGMRRRGGPSVASDYENVLKQTGVTMDGKRIGVVLPVDEDARFERRLASSGSRGGELIALLYASNPESGSGWPVAAFGEIGKRLANNFSARVIAADEPSDRSFTTGVGTLLPRGSIELAEPDALELVAAIARASIVITDETGIARLASELDTPVIQIADALTDRIDSSRTYRAVLGSSRKQVSTDEVYDIACEMIQESRSTSLFERS
ncbi:MAG: hypothetical protein WAV20_01860 [Blastocatellia bacterium]